MASVVGSRLRAKPITADAYERALSLGAVVLLLVVFVALAKGHADLHTVSANIWLHLGAIVIALALTPINLLRRRGDPLHRTLGWVWVSAMMLTAVFSLFVRNVNAGGFSLIHILSVWVLIQVPVIAWTARTHKIVAHRRAVRGMVTGALLVAGFFTFPFDRLLGHWLFS